MNRNSGVSNLKKKQLVTSHERLTLLDGKQTIEVDRPAQFISRITLNSPENGNLINNRIRAQLLEQLMLNDQDPDVRVTIIRGSGSDFCCGYEPQLKSSDSLPLPFYSDELSDGQVARNALQNWFQMQDMAKPIIAQVHGRCLGVGCDLATACDMVYVTADAEIGYPEIRNHGLPDFQSYPWLIGMRNALGMMLLAENLTGREAVEKGWATGCVDLHAEVNSATNRLNLNLSSSSNSNSKLNGQNADGAAVPYETYDVAALELLDAAVIEKAQRVAKIPADLLAYNKRSVYRAFEAQGMRANLRHAVDLQALMWHAPSAGILRRAEQKQAHLQRMKPSALTSETNSNVIEPNDADNVVKSSRSQAKPLQKEVIAESKNEERKISEQSFVNEDKTAVDASSEHAESHKSEKLESQEVAEPFVESGDVEMDSDSAEVLDIDSEGGVLQLIASNSGLDYLLRGATLDIHINEPVRVHLHNGEPDVDGNDPRSKL